MSGNIDMGGNDLKGVGTVDGVNLDDEKSALNTDGSIKGGNYGAVSFKVSYNVKAGTALCNPDYIPTGFTTSECSMITFIPIISGFNGDGGGTETFNIFVEQGSYILNINADSRNTPDNKRNAIILAIGTKPGVEIFTQPDL